MGEENIVRPSFGESVNLGYLYDARSDTFLNYGILEKSMPEKLIITEEKHHKDCKLIPNDTWSTTFSVLDIPKNTQISVLSETVNFDGIRKCFSHVEQGARGAKTLMYKTSILSENIDIFSDELKPFILIDGLNQSNATHIVVKTNRGSISFITIEVSEKPRANQETTIKNIEALISDLSNMLINGDAYMGNSITNAPFKQLTIKLLSDIFPEEQVYTEVVELKHVLKSIQELTFKFNDGKGNIASFEMIPVSKLVEKFNLSNFGTSIFKSISDDITTRFVQVFDDMLLMKRQVHDIQADMKKHEFCISDVAMESHLSLVSTLGSIETKFQHELATNAVKFRSGETDQSALENLLGEFNNQMDILEVLKTKCREDIEQNNVKFEFMDILRQKQVSFIRTLEVLETLSVQNGERNFYLLIYNTKSAREDSQNCKSQLKSFIYLIDSTRAEENFGFAILDNDLVGNPEWTTIAIHNRKGNETISHDVHESVQQMATMCLAFSTEIDAQIKKSVERGNLTIKCPGAFRDHDLPCSDEIHNWQCKTCHDFLQYGFDDHFYCSCGGARHFSYEFKCSDTDNHTLQFIKFKGKDHLTTMLQEIQPYKELNIVILGETGVGKSTWINGFANYLTYDTLSTAVNEKPLCLIPTSFTMRDKKKGKSVLIEFGNMEDQNENNIGGQSSTQEPKSYNFFVNDTRVRLVDTPGIGDTRGIEQDKINFQKIMSHLAHVREIHGICILLKPNNSRLSAFFQFCIQELLTHLHKEACRNIVFVFTNARNTFYSAGDTFPLLEQLLKEKIKGAIKLGENTEYYMDNESVRFLAAHRAGICFPEDEFQIYAQSWEKAVVENRRLLEYICKLQPHISSNTRSLNEARRLILELTKPLAEISKNIHDNILLIERKKAEIVGLDKNKEDLFEKLFIPHINLESQPIPYPRTVCTSKSCIDILTDKDGIEMRDYKTWCHEHCWLKNVLVMKYPIPELQRCEVMNDEGKCTKCGCVWNVHMHITYSTKQVPTKIIDKNVESRIKFESDEINTVNAFIESMDDRLKELNEEQHAINATAAKFGNFLKSNAITPYNDATANYLQYEITNEEALVGKGSDSKRLSCLRDLLQKYYKEVEILENSMKADQKTKAFSSEEIQNMIGELYNLPISGEMLKDMMTVAEKASFKMTEEQAVVLESGPKKGKSINSKYHNALNAVKDVATITYKRLMKYLPKSKFLKTT